jgi:hypothetical protein
MRYPGALSLLVAASLATTAQSFNTHVPNNKSKEAQKAETIPPPRQKKTCASMTPSEDMDTEGSAPAPEPKPDLVPQQSFILSVEAIEREMARVQGVEYVQTDNSKVQYAIGRIMASIPIPPGIDLIETSELVLINGVAQSAIDSGIKPLDTIVGVSVEGTDFKESTLAMNMDDMAQVITAAVKLAKENGKAELGFEMNRLIKGYYG